MCNIGNPQQLGQKPITFFRQVLALCDYPQVRTSASHVDKVSERRINKRVLACGTSSPLGFKR